VAALSAALAASSFRINKLVTVRPDLDRLNTLYPGAA
jgi:hypothetical protein